MPSALSPAISLLSNSTSNTSAGGAAVILPPFVAFSLISLSVLSTAGVLARRADTTPLANLAHACSPFNIGGQSAPLL
jgi:hypothetical protein